MTGPVLVVADNTAIARFAPVWAERFAAAGRLYRVRLVGAGSEREVAAVVVEAVRLSAVTILVAGGEGPLAVATEVARRLGVPLLQEEADGPGAG